MGIYTNKNKFWVQEEHLTMYQNSWFEEMNIHEKCKLE
jgi:hypothetical protein